MNSHHRHQATPDPNKKGHQATPNPNKKDHNPSKKHPELPLHAAAGILPTRAAAGVLPTRAAAAGVCVPTCTRLWPTSTASALLPTRYDWSKPFLIAEITTKVGKH